MSRFILCIILIPGFYLHAFEPFTDTEMGYTIYLPGNWVQEIVSPQQHIFYDTSAVYQSQIAIVRYDFNHNDYETAREWLKVQYISHEYSILYSANPVGSVMYADSSSRVRQGELPAVEFYARFSFLGDPIIWWDEYTRFTAYDTVGYEMYVLGDTSDVSANLDFYLSVLEGVEINSPLSSVIPAVRPNKGNFTSQTQKTVDLLGRRIFPSVQNEKLPAGLYLHKRKSGNSPELFLKGGRRLKTSEQ
ncbi:hypothetical protein QA601_17975 [Chitinispirillales bacterium ANBcel5]|uniref:hypothetical protein n=1 Tax=Cellulosispirillum alkaliphilum TaxID=3039283 RepID=UPI002A507F26|nr:hypothetical protein [Chitinispirillales bacterium ANBcel5]